MSKENDVMARPHCRYWSQSRLHVASTHKVDFDSNANACTRLKCPKMTLLSLCRYYKSCGKSHGKERLKRKALRRPRKTDIEAANVTCRGRLFQN